MESRPSLGTRREISGTEGCRALLRVDSGGLEARSSSLSHPAAVHLTTFPLCKRHRSAHVLGCHDGGPTHLQVGSFSRGRSARNPGRADSSARRQNAARGAQVSSWPPGALRPTRRPEASRGSWPHTGGIPSRETPGGFPWQERGRDRGVGVGGSEARRRAPGSSRAQRPAFQRSWRGSRSAGSKADKGPPGAGGRGRRGEPEERPQRADGGAGTVPCPRR